MFTGRGYAPIVNTLRKRLAIAFPDVVGSSSADAAQPLAAGRAASPVGGAATSQSPESVSELLGPSIVRAAPMPPTPYRAYRANGDPMG